MDLNGYGIVDDIIIKPRFPPLPKFHCCARGDRARRFYPSPPSPPSLLYLFTFDYVSRPPWWNNRSSLPGEQKCEEKKMKERERERKKEKRARTQWGTERW